MKNFFIFYVGVFETVVWTWNEERQAYYYHHFTPQQPDLNLRNERVVRELDVKLLMLPQNFSNLTNLQKLINFYFN